MGWKQLHIHTHTHSHTQYQLLPPFPLLPFLLCTGIDRWASLHDRKTDTDMSEEKFAAEDDKEQYINERKKVQVRDSITSGMCDNKYISMCPCFRSCV